MGNNTSVGMRVRYALDTGSTKLGCTPGGGAASGIWSNEDILKSKLSRASGRRQVLRTVDKNSEKLNQQDASGPLQKDLVAFLQERTASDQQTFWF